MARKATYFLPNIKANDYILWHVCSRTASMATIVLKDDKKTYFTANKTNDSVVLQWLAQNADTYTGGANLRIEIELKGDKENWNIKQSINSYNITDQQAKIVGCGYGFCVEDWEDNDYGDYCINVVAWPRHK